MTPHRPDQVHHAQMVEQVGGPQAEKRGGSLREEPTYLAGKVYTVHAEQIARAIHIATGISSAVTIVAQHSNPLRQPEMIDITLHGSADHSAVAALEQETLATTDHLSFALDGELIPH